MGHTPGMRRRRSDPPLVAAARRGGVTDRRILAALAAVPRERFVPPLHRAEADLDRPIPITEGQTTSQPSLIALMLSALELTGEEKVLEIGTGYGYQAALLAHLAAEVHTIERFPRLASRARENLAACGLDRVHVAVGDGTRGLPEHAPFDAVVIAAAAAEVPPVLAEQVVEGGRVVAPVGSTGHQDVVVYAVRDGQLVPVRHLTGARFVPLVPEDDAED